MNLYKVQIGDRHGYYSLGHYYAVARSKKVAVQLTKDRLPSYGVGKAILIKNNVAMEVVPHG